MPLKGVLLQHWLYDDPVERALTDVDLLVRPEALSEAVALLRKAGYRMTGHATVDGMVMETPFGLLLDLHSQLFDRARYRIPTEEVFARSSQDRDLYGVTVQLPAPLDVYAHLVGKFASDHGDTRATVRLDEIARMGARLDASPATTARHLVHCGMRRAARHALPLVYQVRGDAFAHQVCERLPPDRVGQVIVALARPVFARTPLRSPVGATMAHLLNDTVPSGLRSGARGLLRRRRR